MQLQAAIAKYIEVARGHNTDGRVSVKKVNVDLGWSDVNAPHPQGIDPNTLEGPGGVRTSSRTDLVNAPISAL